MFVVHRELLVVSETITILENFRMSELHSDCLILPADGLILAMFLNL